MDSTTPTEAESFHIFLSREIANGGRHKSPEELVEDWRRTERERAKTRAALQEAIDDMNAGDRGRPVEEVFRDAFRRQGWSEQ